MAHNRKKQSAAIRFGPVLKVFLLCAAIAGSGLGYVWQKNQIYELGQQRLKKEAQLRQLREQNDKLRHQLAELLLPKSLEKKAEELKLGLAPAQPAQILRLIEPPAEPPPPGTRQFAADRTRGIAAP